MATNKDLFLLTERETEILQLLAAGLSNQQIADKLSITLRTVKFHTTNIYSTLRVRSRSQAIVWVWQRGDIEVVMKE